MTPEQTKILAGFATGLATIKAAHDQQQGATLTADEVAGMIWALQQLRGGARRDPADRHPS